MWVGRRLIDAPIMIRKATGKCPTFLVVVLDFNHRQMTKLVFHLQVISMRLKVIYRVLAKIWKRWNLALNPAKFLKIFSFYLKAFFYLFEKFWLFLFTNAWQFKTKLLQSSTELLKWNKPYRDWYQNIRETTDKKSAYQKKKTNKKIIFFWIFDFLIFL